MKTARIAIVHEWWAKYGGAEKVVIEIAKIFKEADVWVLYKDKDVSKNHKDIINFKESWLKYIPFHQNRLFAAIISPIVFRTLTLKKYDIVISSSHTFAHTVKLPRSKNTMYFSYVYTPPRSLWLPEIDSRATILKSRFLLTIAKAFDRANVNHISSIGVISNEIANRVKEFWHVESTLIFPPVEVNNLHLLTSEFIPPFDKGNYLVTAGRFVKYKNHEFAIKVADILKIPLVIMGSGPEKSYLEKIASTSNVNFLFVLEPDKDTWFNVLANSKGLIFAGIEDFGLTPLEAMSVGTPVFALAKGGALDYVVNGLNGSLIETLEPRDFADAIEHFKINREEIVKSIGIFDTSVFRTKFKKWINDQYEQRTNE